MASAGLFGALKRFVSRNVKIRRMNERIWTDRIRTAVRSNSAAELLSYAEHDQIKELVCHCSITENYVDQWCVCVCERERERERERIWVKEQIHVSHSHCCLLWLLMEFRVFVSSVVCFVIVRTEKLRFSWLWLHCHSSSMTQSLISLRFERWTQVLFLVFFNIEL